METSAAKTNWNATFKFMLLVSTLVFTWFYKNTAVYDGALAFFCGVTFIACYHATMNFINQKRRTLTPQNFRYLRFNDVAIAFLTCVCITLETLILHRPFTF